MIVVIDKGRIHDYSYYDKYLSNNFDKDSVFFVITHIDEIEDENEFNKFKEVASEKFSNHSYKNESIFFVNSKGSLSSREEGTIEAEDTGIKKFESALSDYIENDKGFDRIIGYSKSLGEYIDDLKKKKISDYKIKLDDIESSLNAELDKINQKLTELERRKKDAVQEIENEVSSLKNNIKIKVAEKYDNIAGDLLNVYKEKELFPSGILPNNPFTRGKALMYMSKNFCEKIDEYVNSQLQEWFNPDLVEYIEEECDKIKNNSDKIFNDLGNNFMSTTIKKYDEGISTSNRIGRVGGYIGKSILMTGGTFTVLMCTPIGIGPILFLSTAVMTTCILNLFHNGERMTEVYKKDIVKKYAETLRSEKDDFSENFAKEISDNIKNKITEIYSSDFEDEKSKIENDLSEKNKEISKFKEHKSNMTKAIKTMEKRIDLGLKNLNKYIKSWEGKMNE